MTLRGLRLNTPGTAGTSYTAWKGLDRLDEIKALGDLPSPRGAALAVMRLTQRDDASLAELTRAVQTDPALVGRLIKAANSAHAGGHRPVAAVQDALVLLGMQTVRCLALGFSLLSSYRNGKCERFDYRRFWSHSLACAVAMHALAEQVHAAPAEEAFSVGLLCRIGELALATVFPREYDQVLAQRDNDRSLSLEALEHRALTMSHRELTAAMLQDWGLPAMFVEPTFLCEFPERSDYPVNSRQHLIVWSLALARLIADICVSGEAERRSMMPRLFLLGGKLSLDSATLVALCDRIVKDWQDWAAQLEVTAYEVPAFDELSRPPAAPGLTESGIPSPAAGTEGPLRVLVVEDDNGLRLLVRRLLEQAGYEVFESSDGRSGFEKALEIRPHILIADWLMPEMDGVQLTRALRQTKLGRSIYILILTVLEDEERLIEAFDAGVDDFMTKPLNSRVLGARLRAGQRVVTLQQEIERDREDIRRFAAELAVTNRRLREAALTDVLTGLPNRRYAIERLQQEWLASSRSKRPMACMVVDVDRFKTINDSYGHDVGDLVLKETARAIKRGLRAQDVVCRTGGDEFLAICPETDFDAALVCAERVRKSVAEMRMSAGADELRGSVSVGVAARDAAVVDVDMLIKRADEGVYRAKQKGRNCVAWSLPEGGTVVSAKKHL